MKNVAVILSAGKGTRMGSSISKQYMEIFGKPIIYYTIKAFEDSIIDEILLVISEKDRDYVERDIIHKYNFHKINRIVYGGKERYHSVYNALKCVNEEDNVFIHDGARPLITPEQINMLVDKMKIYKACVAGMPVKDTIKLAGEDNNVEQTLERSKLWQVQTPQIFRCCEILKAYEKMMENEDLSITDDAMVMEKYGDSRIRLVEVSYENIKVTTKEDLSFMREILAGREDI